MSKIKILSDDLITRIAAGEVVERPASVLKELIENSVDAGATEIVVTIEGAGRQRLVVSDNGCGMTKEEALLALRRHATSKISKLEDLEAITTFGFRGEALPSIASVSRFLLTTRSVEDQLGWEITVEGGRLVSEKPVARESGTTIEARTIFFNTPARFKFLKSDATERSQCLRVIEEALFASMGVLFELHMEKAGPQVFRPGGESSVEKYLSGLKNRVSEAWGIRWSRGLQPVFAQTDHFRVAGVISSPDFHQPTPKNQFLYVNRRPVLNRRLTRAIYDGYLGQLPSIRHPGWVLFMDLDPRTVDVNVHPAKREVKITHERELFPFLVHAIKEALSKTGRLVETPGSRLAMSSLRSSPVGYDVPPPLNKTLWAAESDYQQELSIRKAAGLHELYKNPKANPERSSETVESPSSLLIEGQPFVRVVAQARKMFLVVEAKDELIMVDQHAAHEKVLYERLQANLKTKSPSSQMLLVPFPWEVSLSLSPLVKENLSLMNAMGFAIEPFGGATYLVKAYPSHLGEKLDLHSLLDGLCDALAEPVERKGSFERNPEHRLAAMAACKAAVKAGDSLTPSEGQRIVESLLECEAPATCPHGRPTMLRWTYAELEHRFRRS